MTATEKTLERIEKKIDSQFEKYDKVSEVVIRHDEMIKNIKIDICNDIIPKTKMVQKHEDKINLMWKFLFGGGIVTAITTIVMVVRLFHS